MIPAPKSLALVGKTDTARGKAPRSEAVGPVLALSDLAQFAALVGRHLAQCRHYGTRHAVILVEVDLPLRPGNQATPAVMNQLLDAAGARLRARVRDTDIVARLDGRRFGVMLTDAARADLDAVQARLFRALSGHYGMGDQLLLVAPRLGAAMYPASGTTGPELTQAALALLLRSSADLPWVGHEGRFQSTAS